MNNKIFPPKIIINERQFFKILFENDINNKLRKFNITEDDIEIELRNAENFDYLYPQDNNDYTDDEDCAFSSKAEYEKLLNSVLDFFIKFPELIKVYRAIHVEHLNDVDYKNIGGSWTFSYDSANRFAQSMWGNSSNVILTAYIPFNKVDWASTIALYIEDIASPYNTGFHENEIYVTSSHDLKNIEVYRSRLKEHNTLMEVKVEGGNYIESDIPSIDPSWDKEPIDAITDGYYYYEYLENGKKILKMEYKKSQQSDSEYYVVHSTDGTIQKYRVSDHWSLYKVNNYMVRNYPLRGDSRFINLRWGSYREIGGEYYNLILSRDRTVKLQKDKNFNSTIHSKLDKQKEKQKKDNLKDIKLPYNTLNLYATKLAGRLIEDI